MTGRHASRTALEAFMIEDGCRFPDDPAADKKIPCVFHADGAASLGVDAARGTYNCFGCGASGNAWTWLVEHRKLDRRAAAEALRAAGWSDDNIDAAVRQAKEKERKLSRKPKLADGPFATAKAKVGGKEHPAPLVRAYGYRNADGKAVAIVARYELALADGTTLKTFHRYTRCGEADGKWWCCGPTSDLLPARDRLNKLPLYNLDKIIAKNAADERDGLGKTERRPIWLVEGEKVVEAMENCRDKPDHVAAVVTTLMGGTVRKADGLGDKHDLAPLYGARVNIMADADQAGRDHALAVGRHLFEHGSEVWFLLPPGDDGADLADAAGSDGWAGVNEFVNASGRTLPYDAVFPPQASGENDGEELAGQLADTGYFRVMGLEGEFILILNKKTHYLHRHPARHLAQEGVLMTIAPLAYWRALAGGFQLSQTRRSSWADAITRAAENIGQTTSTRYWARGARNTERGYVFHCGSHLLAENGDGDLERVVPLFEQDTSDIYVPKPAVTLRDDGKAAEYCRDLAAAVMSYRWELESHGAALIGWIVSSIVGGALAFRPAVWLTALSGTGKTYLLENVLLPVLGPLLTPITNATAAGLAAAAGDDALPVYIDEFEPDDDRSTAQKEILNLLRIATQGSGLAKRFRGTPTGAANALAPRFSLLMSSIERPLLSKANESRIYNIRLATRGVDNWLAVRDAIAAATTPERCAAIRTRIIRNVKHICLQQRVIEDELMAPGDMESREAQILSALGAGAGFMLGDFAYRLEGPRRMDDDDKGLGKYGPLYDILSMRVRMPPSEEFTLAEVVRQGWYTRDGRRLLLLDADKEEFRDLAKRFGLVIEDGRLLVADGYPPLAKMLQRTAFHGHNLTEFLLRLDGSSWARTASGSLKRLRFGGVQCKAVALASIAMVDLLGVSDEDPPPSGFADETPF